LDVIFGHRLDGWLVSATKASFRGSSGSGEGELQLLLVHAPTNAARAKRSSFTGPSHDPLGPALVADQTAKSPAQDAAVEKTPELALDVGGQTAAVAATLLEKGLEVAGHCLIEHGLLGLVMEVASTLDGARGLHVQALEQRPRQARPMRSNPLWRLADLGEPTPRRRASGKYLSVTATFVAESRAQIDAIYRELNGHDLVVMTL
jgi:hypothetical protein